MAFPNDQLFLDRFIAYNQERYKDEHDFVDALSTLTLGTVAFTNFRKAVNAGVISYLVDVESPNLFTGVDQKYTPADYSDDGIANLIEPDPLTLEDLKTKGMQGFYLLSGEGGSSTGAILVSNGDLSPVMVKSIIKNSCQYALLDTEITVDFDVTTATIDSHTVVGTLTIVEADLTGAKKYDGTYKHDGTITY